MGNLALPICCRRNRSSPVWQVLENAAPYRGMYVGPRRFQPFVTSCFWFTAWSFLCGIFFRSGLKNEPLLEFLFFHFFLGGAYGYFNNISVENRRLARGKNGNKSTTVERSWPEHIESHVKTSVNIFETRSSKIKILLTNFRRKNGIIHREWIMLQLVLENEMGDDSNVCSLFKSSEMHSPFFSWFNLNLTCRRKVQTHENVPGILYVTSDKIDLWWWFFFRNRPAFTFSSVGRFVAISGPIVPIFGFGRLKYVVINTIQCTSRSWLDNSDSIIFRAQKTRKTREKRKSWTWYSNSRSGDMCVWSESTELLGT